jgi:hypothetical protein
VTCLGARPSTFGKVIGAGGLNNAPDGWMVTMKRGCWPKPGTMGTLSGCTTVTLTQPVCDPPGNVTCPGANVSEKPGASGIVSVPPPVVAVTQSWLLVLIGNRYIAWPTVLIWPATVTMS